MTNIPDNALPDGAEDDNTDSTLKRSNATGDIHDSAKDEEELKEEPFTLDLPDVADIPGQEHVHVPQLNQFADTTIASDDEEGEGLFEDDADEDTDLVMDKETDVDPAEKRALRTAS